MGSSSSSTSPYSSLLPTTMKRGDILSPRSPSSRFTCDRILVVRVSAGVFHEAWTKLWAARWITWVGLAVSSSARTEERSRRSDSTSVDLRPEVVDVVGLAAPADGAEHLRALGQGVLGHVAAHEPGDAGDQVAAFPGLYATRRRAPGGNRPPPGRDPRSPRACGTGEAPLHPLAARRAHARPEGRIAEELGGRGAARPGRIVEGHEPARHLQPRPTSTWPGARWPAPAEPHAMASSTASGRPSRCDAVT